MTEIQTENANLDPKTVVKGVATFVATTSVGWTIGNVIGNTTNATKGHQKMMIRVTAMVATGLANDPVKQFVSVKVDTLFDHIEKIRVFHKENVSNTADSE